MDCGFCTSRPATVLVVAAAGPEIIRQWAVCDWHARPVKQALMMAWESCRQYEMAVFTDLDTGTETRWDRAEATFTMDELVREFEPGQMSCPGCGRVCVSVDEASRCEKRHDERKQISGLGQLAQDILEQPQRLPVDPLPTTSFPATDGRQICKSCYRLFRGTGKVNICEQCRMRALVQNTKKRLWRKTS